MKFKIIILLYLLAVLSAYSQVTIGSGHSPRNGTLLDLKQNTNSGQLPNSTKALGLPKIALEDPNELQISEDGSYLDYIGVIVSNTSANSNFGKGIYGWDGQLWNELASSKSKGKDFQVLTLLTDGKSDWVDVPQQTYNYYKPATSAYFVKEGSKPRVFEYVDVVSNGASGSTPYEAKPASTIFEGKYLYSTKFNTDNTGRQKLVEIAFSTEISLATRGDVLFLDKSVWHQYQYWVIIDGEKRHSLIQTYNSTFLPFASFNQYHKFLLSKDFATGEHTLDIEVELLSSSFKRNEGTSAGSFNPSKKSFLSIEILNCNMLMYEN